MDMIIFALEDMEDWESLGFVESAINYIDRPAVIEYHCPVSGAKLTLHDDCVLSMLKDDNEIILSGVNLCFVADLIEILARQ